MFTFISKRAPILRAVAVVSVVGALVTSVTYATLQSPSATLTGNTISTASANLVIGTTSATSSSFAASKTGFTFGNVVPGGTASADNAFYLRNTGTATLAVKMSVGSTPTNTSSVDLAKVNVTVTRTDVSNSLPQTTTLDALLNPSTALALTDTLAPNTSSTAASYKVSVSMAADAFTGSSASIGGIDFVFNGAAITN